MNTFQRTGKVDTSISLNRKAHVERPQQQTIIIAGIPRGGTSMVAAVIEALGIDLGPREDMDAFNFEDQKMQSAYIEVRAERVKQRNKECDVWGWKDPVGITRVQDTTPLLRNPYVILVSRDPLATIQGELRFDKAHASLGLRTLKDITAQTRRWWNCNFDFIQDTKLPTLLVSYERAINNPPRFVSEVCDFLSLAPTEEEKQKAIERISPAGGYLTTMSEPVVKIKLEDIDWRYINLSHRIDRRKNMKVQMRRSGILVKQFSALRKEDYTGLEEKVSLMRATPNTIGNWLSHTALIAEARDTGKIIGVLEDDCLLCIDMQQRLRYVEGHFLNKPWDIFFLGATFHTTPGGKWHPELGRDFELTETQHIVKVYGAFSNQGYLVNPQSADKILFRMNEIMHKSTGSDHALIQLQPELNCYCFVPGMVFQIDGPSDIGEGVTKFSNFFNLGPHVWTERLSEFDWGSWETKQKETVQ